MMPQFPFGVVEIGVLDIGVIDIVGEGDGNAMVDVDSSVAGGALYILVVSRAWVVGVIGVMAVSRVGVGGSEGIDEAATLATG